MPIVSVGRDVLFSRLGRTYTDAEFDELCFEFGIELDDVTSAREMYFREFGSKAAAGSAEATAEVAKAAEGLSDAVLYKVDIPANRYDLLSLEGLVRALRIFLGLDPLPDYGYLSGGDAQVTIKVQPAVGGVRPYVVGAVIRGINFDEDTYNSFLDFQDKLHFTLCRRRTLVAIGTHDLDTVKGPFSYDARAPKDIRFRPLFQDREYQGSELWGLYASDANFKSYMQIIGTGDAEGDRYPIITDSEETVLSMPPVINGEHSKLTMGTRNVLVECTATDLSKAHQVLNTIVCNFSQYATEQYKVERVRIVAADGSEHLTPNLSSRVVRVPGDAVRSGIGAPIPTDQMSTLLTKMQLPTETDGDDLVVTVPALRTDILHPCDVIEDVAIAYGYNNIVPTVPNVPTMGQSQPVNELADLLRGALAHAGYTEALTLVLCRRAELFEAMRLEDGPGYPSYPYPSERSLAGEPPADAPGSLAITIANPKGVDFETARCSLAPSLLKTVAANKAEALPLRLFEVADVVTATGKGVTDVGAKNNRRLCAVHVDNGGGFEVIHGLLDRVMEQLDIVTRDPALSTSGFKYKRSERWYEIEAETDHPSFFPSRCARVVVMGEVVGHFGIVHPDVCHAYGITAPTALLEMTIEPFA